MYAGLNIIDELEKERHINDKIVNATAPLVLRFFYNFVVGSSSYSVDNSIHN